MVILFFTAYNVMSSMVMRQVTSWTSPLLFCFVFYMNMLQVVCLHVYFCLALILIKVKNKNSGQFEYVLWHFLSALNSFEHCCHILRVIRTVVKIVKKKKSLICFPACSKKCFPLSLVIETGNFLWKIKQLKISFVTVNISSSDI